MQDTTISLHYLLTVLLYLTTLVLYAASILYTIRWLQRYFAPAKALLFLPLILVFWTAVLYAVQLLTGTQSR